MSPHLNLLKNRIDITRVPFSDRGSRLLVFKKNKESAFFIKLAERLTALQPDIDAYRYRPPFIRDLHLIDSEGNLLDFELTVYPHALYMHTRLGDFGLTFQDKHTLTIGLPPKKTAGIRFHASTQYWEKTKDGGAFKAVRNLGYNSNGKIIHNQIKPESTGEYAVEFIVKRECNATITLNISNNLSQENPVIPFSKSCTAAKSRWHAWFKQAPPVNEKYKLTYTYAWWIMASNLISPQGKVAYEAMAPSKLNYVGLWLWDSAMHVLAYRHIDPELARNQLRAMLACQLADGMLPDAIYDEGIIANIEHPFRAEVTKPPILAWAALKLHEMDPNLDFLEEIYIPLVRWNAWWFGMNDDDVDGLAQYNHPYSSGLDDSPLWDYGMPVESPDLNTYLCVQMGSLALIAEALNMEAEAVMWRRRAAAIVRRMIQDFWDEDTGLFHASHNNQPIPVVTPFNLYPLWTGQLPDHICDKLLQHLTNPNEFWGDYMLPTVAYNDPHYNPRVMWRGPVWANINYFFIEALHQIGHHDLANHLRDKTLQLIMEQTSIYEYYNSETGSPPKTAEDTFGWTAAVFIDLAIQASQE